MLTLADIQAAKMANVLRLLTESEPGPDGKPSGETKLAVARLIDMDPASVLELLQEDDGDNEEEPERHYRDAKDLVHHGPRRYAAIRVPKGMRFVINGRTYVGGMFMPSNEFKALPVQTQNAIMARINNQRIATGQQTQVRDPKVIAAWKKRIQKQLKDVSESLPKDKKKQQYGILDHYRKVYGAGYWRRIFARLRLLNRAMKVLAENKEIPNREELQAILDEDKAKLAFLVSLGASEKEETKAAGSPRMPDTASSGVSPGSRQNEPAASGASVVNTNDPSVPTRKHWELYKQILKAKDIPEIPSDLKPYIQDLLAEGYILQEERDGEDTFVINPDKDLEPITPRHELDRVPHGILPELAAQARLQNNGVQGRSILSEEAGKWIVAHNTMWGSLQDNPLLLNVPGREGPYELDEAIVVEDEGYIIIPESEYQVLDSLDPDGFAPGCQVIYEGIVYTIDVVSKPFQHPLLGQARKMYLDKKRDPVDLKLFLKEAKSLKEFPQLPTVDGDIPDPLPGYPGIWVVYLAKLDDFGYFRKEGDRICYLGPLKD